MTESPYSIAPAVLASVDPAIAWHYGVIPFSTDAHRLELLCDETAPGSAGDELELLLNKKIVFQKQGAATIDALLATYYRKEQQDSRLQSAWYTGEADSFLTHLIAEARQQNSSDIHIESLEETGRVRIRIDGMLVQRYLLEKKQYPSLINKIKIIANLDIAEKRLPQ